MKILIFSQYFWPEAFIINDFVKNLVEQGHEVTVATGKPNYPNGDIFPGYKARGLIKEKYLDRVDVVRIPIYPRGRGGAKKMVLNYFSFIFSGLFFFPWLLRKKKFEAIMVFAPSPIVQTIPAILLKYLKRAHLSIWVQDLWPESLAATNFVTNPVALKMVGWVVKLIYARTDTLFVQSKAFMQPILKYASADQLVYFPNSFDSKSMQLDSNFPIAEDLQEVLQKKFSFVFAGNLGTAQSLETIVKAAQLVKDVPNCQIVIVGSGSLSKWLENEIIQNKIKNIFIAGRYPMEAMPTIFSYSKVLLVTLKKDPLFDLTIPSKIQAYMAAGKPILAALDGEGGRVINEAGAGIVCCAEDSVVLAQNMREMCAMSEAQLAIMSKKSKDYFDNNFEMSTQVKYFTTILNDKINV
ncbi:MAG: glycosyltransferase family 4 protein [Bdellovibrio sp.]|nr:glycosyltransferase family 4 protein [Bdellovibrio sp.]